MADFLLQLPPVQQRRPRNYRFNANVLNYTDEELRARYRFGRESIQYITNLIETDFNTAKNKPQSRVEANRSSADSTAFLCEW